MNAWVRRLRYLLGRGRFDEELANEMEFHREMAGRDGSAMRFGNTLRLREEAREAWGWMWLDRVSQDVRYALRMFCKSPGFTLTAVTMLALGIGVNVAAFGFFNLMVWRPLPVRDPGTLVRFDRRSAVNGADNFLYPEVAFFAEHSKTLSAVLARGGARLAMEGEQKPLGASFVTANYFRELGGRARLGRLLEEARDGGANADPVVVLSQAFWQRRFGADTQAIGRRVRLNNKPAMVIGVASEEFSGLGLGTPDVWAPITQQPYYFSGESLADFSERGISVQMWGRLQPRVAPKVAEAELASLAARLWKEHPKEIWEKETLPSVPGGYAITLRGEMYPVLGLAGALGLLILAAACTTLGSLQLARGMTREREISIRTAVGAGRGRLMRQLFTESLVLALLGALAGLALGYAVLRVLMAWTESPAWMSAMPDWRVAGFAMGVGLGAAILFGLTPAWQVARQVARQGQRAPRMRQILIGTQVAASCVLLIVSGLLARALEHAISKPLGFAYANVLALDPGFQAYTPAKANAYFSELRNRLSSIPGVESVSLVSNPPLGNRWTVAKTIVAGRGVDIHYNNIDGEFFRTMEIPLLRGRGLAVGDERAIVISESLARLRWPAENPIGQKFQTGLDAAGAPVYDIVAGVAGNARLVSPEDSDAVEIYRFAGAEMLPSMVVMVRVAGQVEALAPRMMSAAKSIDPALYPEVRLLKTAFQEKVRQAGYMTMAVSLLGTLALVLACIGMVGLVAYAVTQRTKEIGIRVALGAKPAQVLSIVLLQFSIPIAAGVAGGTAGAAALSRILRQELFGISGLDPWAYAAGIGVFLLATAAAVLIPARQALRVDPMLALRYE